MSELRAISPFPTENSKDLYCRHVKKGFVSERFKYYWRKFYWLKLLAELWRLESKDQAACICKLILLCSALCLSWNKSVVVKRFNFRHQDGLLTHNQTTKFQTGPNWNKLQTILLSAFKMKKKKKKYVSYTKENIVKKGEIAWYKQFLLFS